MNKPDAEKFVTMTDELSKEFRSRLMERMSDLDVKELPPLHVASASAISAIVHDMALILASNDWEPKEFVEGVEEGLLVLWGGLEEQFGIKREERVVN